MSCVAIFDNDTTLTLPIDVGSVACVVVEVPDCRSHTHRSASATAILRFDPDGTWKVTASGLGLSMCGNTQAAPVGILTTGRWIDGTFNPADYQLRITAQRRLEYTTKPISGQCKGPMNPVVFEAPIDTGWKGMVGSHELKNWFDINNSQVCVLAVNVVLDFTATIRRVANIDDITTGAGSLCVRVTNIADP